jgi:hypothetical protein
MKKLGELQGGWYEKLCIRNPSCHLGRMHPSTFPSYLNYGVKNWKFSTLAKLQRWGRDKY